MKREFILSYEGSYTVSIRVQAESEAEAEELAEMPSVTQYCGNGGCEQLIGVDFYDEGEPTIEDHGFLEHKDTYDNG